MRYFLIALLCFICLTKTYAQTGRSVVVEITKEKKPKRVFVKVIESSYADEDSSWAKSLEETLNKTIKLDRKVKEGTNTVSFKFLVERDGSMADWRCVNDPGFELCAQVRFAVIRCMSPSWRPIDSSGTKVISYKTSAITKDTTALKNLPDSLQ